MSGGGKGGSQTSSSTVSIPPYLEEPIKRNIERAEEISRFGSVPYYGIDVAAPTPMQEAAMRNTGMAAQAYGLSHSLGNQVVPEPQTFAGGVRGYSSGALYDQALAELQSRRPGQYDAIMSQFIDPITGEGDFGTSETGEMSGTEEFYRSMGYQEVQPYEASGVSYGVVRTPSGKLFMSPVALRNMRGR